MTNAFLNMLDTRDWILADGATGTNLFNMGLSSGMPLSCGTKPTDNIRKLYQMAVDAGSDLFLTNSFGGNSARLKLTMQATAHANSLGCLLNWVAKLQMPRIVLWWWPPLSDRQAKF